MSHVTRNRCTRTDLSGKETLIYPGGNTQCAFEDSKWWKTEKAFKFRVQPGDGANAQRVLLYFHKGGGCMSDTQCSNKFGKKSTLRAQGQKPMPATGIFDDTNSRNPFQGWPKISILYCSGDAHVGNMIHKWKSGWYRKGKTIIHQNGMNNVNAVLDWLVENYPKPEELILSSCSAGSLGFQLHAARIRAMYPNVSNFAVLVDRYVPSRQSEIVNYWNACKDKTLGLSTQTLKKSRAGKMTYPELCFQDTCLYY